MKIKNIEKFKTDITNALMAGLPYNYCVERTTIGKTTEFCLKADEYESNYYLSKKDDFKCVALYDVIKVAHKETRKTMFISFNNDDSMTYIDEGDRFNIVDVGADFEYYDNRLEYMVALTSYIINFLEEA